MPTIRIKDFEGIVIANKTKINFNKAKNIEINAECENER